MNQKQTISKQAVILDQVTNLFPASLFCIWCFLMDEQTIAKFEMEENT